MKSVHFLWLALIICSLIFVSCNKRTQTANHNSVKAFSEYLGEPVNLDVKGKVLDSNQNPLDSVIVNVGKTFSITDSNGNFIIENASVHDNFLTIEAQKKGYKSIFHSLNPKEDTMQIQIILLKESELSLFRFSKYNHNLPQPNH
ncbi:hypothetical protein [Winogradskyella sp.]|uniref:hypothetical protein n=1 Tax=Winogradskyella sp. TaxID=1883156 RepID=UPI00262E526F|nr:hypothetical protein [Winogradskyella sp.]